MKKQHQFAGLSCGATLRVCLYCLLVIGLSGGGMNARAKIIDRIVAQVNEDIITLYDVNKALEPKMDKIKEMGYGPEAEQQMIFKARNDVLSELINENLTDQEVRKAGITVNDNEIDAALEQVKEANFLTEEDLVAALAQEGLTLDKYRENMKRQMQRSKLMNREVKSKIVITDVDIKKYYDAHPEKYAGKMAYHLKTIIKRVPAISDEKRMTALAGLMEGIVEQLDNGDASFDALAREHSDLLAEEGGDLGTFELDSLSPEIRNAVADLKAGEHSPVVATQQGFQIFYVEEIANTSGQPLESVADEIKDTLYKEVMEQKISQWVNSLKENAHIKIMK